MKHSEEAYKLLPKFQTNTNSKQAIQVNISSFNPISLSDNRVVTLYKVIRWRFHVNLVLDKTYRSHSVDICRAYSSPCEGYYQFRFYVKRA